MLTYTDLSEAFKRPNQVRILDLRNQGLNKVPAEVFQFRNLTQLHLYNNHNVVSQLEGNVRRKTVTNFDQLLTYQELQQKLVTE